MDRIANADSNERIKTLEAERNLLGCQLALERMKTAGTRMDFLLLAGLAIVLSMILINTIVELRAEQAKTAAALGACADLVLQQSLSE